MPQGPLGIAKDRVPFAESEGGPKPAGLVASRVSTTRQGGIATKCSPAVELDTTISPLVPVMVDDNKSLALSETVPGVTNEAENVPTPLVSVESAGSVAAGSVLVKCT